MNVCIGLAGSNRGKNFGEITGKDLLATVRRSRRGNDIRSRDGSAKLTRASRALRNGRNPSRSGIGRGLAKPDNDAAAHVALADMDVGLSHVSLQSCV